MPKFIAFLLLSIFFLIFNFFLPKKALAADLTGYNDSPTSSEYIYGWAKDNSDDSKTVVVKFYKDTTAAEGGEYIGKVGANILRNDVGMHAFHWRIPNQFLRNSNKIYAYATDSNEKPIYLLGNISTVVQLTDNPPIGYLESISDLGVVTGWATDPDTNNPLTIKFYKNGMPGSVFAEYMGETVGNRAGANPGDRNFRWQIPTKYLQSSFRVYAVASNYGGNSKLDTKIDNSPQIYIPQNTQIENRIFYIVPVWHRLDLPDTSVWSTMYSRLGGDHPYIKIGLGAYSQYTNHTGGPPSYDYIGDSNYYESTGAVEHRHDSLGRFFDFAKQYNYNAVVVNMNGSPWDEGYGCSCPNSNIFGCSSSATNVLTFLEEKDINVQWTQDNKTFQDSCTNLPPLQRNVTLNLYNKDVQYYLEKNLKQAVKFILADPFRKDITKAISIDADGFLAVWDIPQNTYYDYNPDTLQQFRDWLFCKGLYSPTGDMPFFRRSTCFSDLNSLNSFLGTSFTDYISVEPQRPNVKGYGDLNNKLWNIWLDFRKHLVFQSNLLKFTWASEAGFPPSKIYGHLGITKDVGDLEGSNNSSFDIKSAGTIQANGLYPFGNGGNYYGNDAKNSNNTFFQRIKKANNNWGVFETSAATLSDSTTLKFSEYYKSIQQTRLFGGAFLMPMAWHVDYSISGPGSAGVRIRDTAYEDALREFNNLYGNYPLNDVVWEFGSTTSSCVDKTGVTAAEMGSCAENVGQDRTNLEGWQLNKFSVLYLEDGVVNLKITSSDPNFISPSNIAFKGLKDDYLILNTKLFNNNQVTTGRVYFITDSETGWSEDKSVTFTVIGDGAWRKVFVNMGNSTKWTNSYINTIRVDIDGCPLGTEVSFDYVWITRNLKSAFDYNYDGVVDRSDTTILTSNLFSNQAPPVSKKHTLLSLLEYLSNF